MMHAIFYWLMGKLGHRSWQPVTPSRAASLLLSLVEDAATNLPCGGEVAYDGVHGRRRVFCVWCREPARAADRRRKGVTLRYPAAQLFVPSTAIGLVVALFVHHGPVRAGEAGPVTHKPHTTGSALAANIAAAGVALWATVRAGVLFWDGGAIRRGRSRSLRVEVPPGQIGWSSEAIHLWPSEALEVVIDASTLPKAPCRVFYVLGFRGSPGSELCVCSKEKRQSRGRRGGWISLVVMPREEAEEYYLGVRAEVETNAPITLGCEYLPTLSLHRLWRARHRR